MNVKENAKVSINELIDSESSSSVEYKIEAAERDKDAVLNTVAIESTLTEKNKDEKGGHFEVIDLDTLKEVDIVDLTTREQPKARVKVQLSSGSSTTYTVYGEDKPERQVNESQLDLGDLLETIRGYHVITCNKLDLLLKYYEDELLQERSKRQVLEHKLESIDKLIQSFESGLLQSQ